MEPKVTTIQGNLRSGRTGIRYEHNVKIGDAVRLPDGRHGKVISEGMAGMPEVETSEGNSELCSPLELQIIYPCRECGTMGLGIPDTICPICGGE